jgi:D-hydroxyproline dehydrogenase subunit beta
MGNVERIEADVCVVGAGVVGLAHALEARVRGLSVAVLDRAQRAAGASVRNFGHIIVSGMASGEPLDAALRARERWLDAGRRTGLEVHESGTLIVARAADELEVLAGIAADAQRGARLVTPAQIAALAPIPTGGLLGGLHATLDLRVDPRRAAAALAALLVEDPGVTMRWGAPVHAIETGAVAAASIDVRADLVIVCPGPDYDWLAPQLRPRRPGLTRCKLQMIRVAAPGGRRYGPALLTGLSLLRYPGYSIAPGADELRARIAAEAPELVAAGLHLIVTQLSGGDLVLGDTHEYGDTVSPFGDERLDELVLAEARRLLGVDALEVRQRWHGVYPTADGDPFLIEWPLDGVAVVEVVSGIGMTTGLGLAPLTFAAAQAGAPTL